jgi:hypothetical protein
MTPSRACSSAVPVWWFLFHSFPHRDLIFLSNDEPPRRITSRLEVARLVGYAPPAPAKRPRQEGEASSEEEEEEEPVSRKLNALKLLQAAMARRTPYGGSLGAKGAGPAAAPARASEPGACRPKAPAAAPKKPRTAEEEPRAAPPPERPPAPMPPSELPAAPVVAGTQARAGPAPPARTFKRPVILAARRVAHVCTGACPLQCAGWVGLAALVGGRT